MSSKEQATCLSPFCVCTVGACTRGVLSDRQTNRHVGVTDQGSWPSREIDKRPDEKSRQGFIGAPAVAWESKNKQHFLFFAPWGGVGRFFMWTEGSGISRGWARREA